MPKLFQSQTGLVFPQVWGARPGLGRTNLAHFSSALSRVLTPYCVCWRGCPRSECVTAEALSLALVVVSVGDMRGSEESLTGFFFALDACDLEEALGRVVQEPCQVGGFVRPFACEDTGGLIVVTQLKGVLIGAGPVGPVWCDQKLTKTDAQWLEVEAIAQ